MASSSEEVYERSILAAQAQPGMNLAKGATKAIGKLVILELYLQPLPNLELFIFRE